MKVLAAYIMRGHIQAAGVIGLFAVLGWMFPPFLLISSAALGLVVLKQGSKEGVQVLSGAILFCGVVAYVRFGTPILALLTSLAIWLPVWLCVQVLRATRSQTSVLIVVMAMSLLLAVGIRYFVGDIQGFWQESLTSYSNRVALVANVEQQSQVISSLAVIMNGFVAVSFGLMIMMSLLLARWWQSLLFNPGGFGEEFRKIQLPVLIAAPILLSAILMGVVKLSIPPYGLVLDLLMIGTATLMFHGLAIVHFFVKERQLGNGWLAGVYFFLMVASVYVFSILAMLAISDSFSNFRKLRSKAA